MPKLTITRGLPGSGKTTYAEDWVAERPADRARVNRDSLRLMLHNNEYKGNATESRILAARDTLITTLLREGVDVVVDDTNLPQSVARDLADLAARAGAELTIYDLTHVPVEECVRRDAARAAQVGETVIREMHRKYLKGKLFPLPWPEARIRRDSPDRPIEPYVPLPGTVGAVILDIDGTAAKRTLNGRSPYDETRVDEDLPNRPVIKAAKAMWKDGYTIVVMSGRSDACKDATVRWLQEHLGVPFVGPFMRRHGDTSPDWLVKARLFNAHVRDEYNVEFVLDDRDQVVTMWRKSLGLTVFQVAEGNF